MRGGDAKGGILTNITPANIETWHYTQPDMTASINDLSCPSTSLCVGVDSGGRVIHYASRDLRRPGFRGGCGVSRGGALRFVSY